MYLISQREVNAVLKDYPDDLTKLKQAVGASDIISTNLICDNNRCKVSFTRLVAKENQADKLLVKSERNWLAPIDKFNVIFSTSQTQFASLFPEQAEVNQSGLVQRPINEQDYRQYIELYSKIKGQGDYNKDSLVQLESLLNRSPYLYAAYGLFRETASNLYIDTRDNSYLEKLRRVLQQSPPEYRYSVYHAIDSFWLASYQGDMPLAEQHILEAKNRGLDNLTETELHAYYYFINGQYQNAIDSYKGALKLRPSIRVRYNLALTYWHFGNIKKSEVTLTEVLNITPDHLSAQRLQANIWLLQGKLEETITAYKTIVQKVENGKDLTNLSLAYALNKQYFKSKEFAMRAYQKSPKNSLRLLNLADIEMILGNSESARSYYKKVINILIGKNEVRYLTNLAQAYAHLQQADLAISAINQAQALAPNNGEVSYASAIVYSLLGESISATYHIKLALQDNIGLVWFNLPWFDLLCTNNEFINIMNNGNNLERCSTIE
jgi:serine/threonine-protein kinase